MRRTEHIAVADFSGALDGDKGQRLMAVPLVGRSEASLELRKIESAKEHSHLIVPRKKMAPRTEPSCVGLLCFDCLRCRFLFLLRATAGGMILFPAMAASDCSFRRHLAAEYRREFRIYCVPLGDQLFYASNGVV